MPRLPLRHPGEGSRHYTLRLARRPLRRLGYDIQRVQPKRRETLEQALNHLPGIGVRPRTVIDVGVAAGTPELYDAFPDAYYLLVEPMAETEPQLKRILEQVEGEYVVAAATSTGGTVELLVSPDPVAHWGSTIFAGRGEQTKNWVARTVPAVRLDDVVAERGLEGPFLIKADTEGSELEVLGGAGRVLEDTLAVALEVSLVDKAEGAPRFADVIAFMAARSFVTYDIVAGYNRESDGALALVDVVFLREDAAAQGGPGTHAAQDS